MPKRILNVLLPLLFASSLSACGARVILTDTEWCADAGERGAFCFRTLSSATRHVPEEQWTVERYGQICTTAPTFAEWKAALLKLCEDSGRCDFKTEEAIEKFARKASRARRKAVGRR